MKKNLLTVSAFVLAIGFSAFTTKHHASNPKLTDPFWYSYNSANGTLTGFIAQEPEADLIAHTNCTDDVLPICAKGYTSSQGSTFPITAPTGATNVLKMSNP